MTEFVLIDWGTSNLRFWLVDEEGNILSERHSELGMSKLRPDDYEPLLESILTEAGVNGQVPVLICGMAGAAQGWVDAGYRDIPVNLDEISAHAKQVSTRSAQDVRILPGLAQRDPEAPNVMRGEETLLAGALELSLQTGCYCLPGTHSKWVFMEDNTITYFSTFMTGELFALMSGQSTLAHYLAAAGESEICARSFKASVVRALKNPELIPEYYFNIRSSPLLAYETDAASLSSQLSGLLIGSELAAIRSKLEGKVILIASGRIAELYRLAFDVAEIDHDIADSGDLALAGLSKAARQIWTRL